MAESLVETSENKPARDERGRLLPGYTANPLGRPKGSFSLLGLLKTELENVPEGEKITRAIKIIRKICKQAEGGNEQSQKLIMEYVEGKPKQPLEFGFDKENLSELTFFFRAMAKSSDE